MRQRGYFPILDPRAASHPYELFYLIWRLSFLAGTAYADASFAFENLCATPDVWITQLMHAAGIKKYDSAHLSRLIKRGESVGQWTRYAPREWFEEREALCEERLADYAGACDRHFEADRI